MLEAAARIGTRAPRVSGVGNRVLAARLAALTLARAGRPRFASDLEKREAALVTKIWLGLVDEERYALSWTAAGPALRDAIAEADWVRALGSTRRPLGRCLSRRVVSTTSLWGPSREARDAFVVIRFEGRLEHGARVAETVAALRGADGAWRAATYFIDTRGGLAFRS